MSGLSDDDVRAATERAPMALRAELFVALLKAPSRDHCLDIARQYRKLLASAVAAADPENMKRIETAMALDRAKVVAIFGTSAWDEPTHSKPLPPESK